ncbi:uncharacterized protein CMU_015140 [Cryptosporidium muris RN66]|uniref:Pantothenate kinase n=1 Tax=Cryptosporidium muris (strain RN66) TaxID=441375 RepID=B6AF71_CRYMR|nr:uncharacterized protein CMU_015140 [Cryptosporidium muris RN66]EEA06838.1 hypothetical protein, conserved [Cryptosporidium muris RN66]|eukprot:XP_002141187.1 hypothetical protein [Cryptosporidium muris RN66]
MSDDKDIFTTTGVEIVTVEVFQGLSNSKRCAFDIGGTLVKLIYKISLESEHDEAEENKRECISKQTLKGHISCCDYKEEIKYNFYQQLYNKLEPEEINTIRRGQLSLLLEPTIKRSGTQLIFCVICRTYNHVGFQLDKLIEFAKKRKLIGEQPNSYYIAATGGGAFRFAEFINSIGYEVIQYDEMLSNIQGLICFMSKCITEKFIRENRNPLVKEEQIFEIDNTSGFIKGSSIKTRKLNIMNKSTLNIMEFKLTTDYSKQSNLESYQELNYHDLNHRLKHVLNYSINGNISKINYPFLLVCIGSGVSIVKVFSEDKFERVSGTPLGGGTVFGLARILCNISNINELKSLYNKDTCNTDAKIIKEQSILYSKNKYTEFRGKHKYDAENSSGITQNISTRFNQHKGVRTTFFGNMKDDLEIKRQFNRREIAHNLIEMANHEICYLTCLMAMKYHISHVYATGSYVAQGFFAIPTFKNVMTDLKLENINLYLIHMNGFLGSLGALI